MQPTALYRHFDITGVLLYVGISLSPAARTSEHKRNAPWFIHVRRIEIEWFETRAFAEEAERDAIRTEEPRYNRAHMLSPQMKRKEARLKRMEMLDKRKATRKRIADAIDLINQQKHVTDAAFRPFRTFA